MISIYDGESEQYMGLITNEAYHRCRLYFEEWQQQIGRIPQPNQMFLRQEGDLYRELGPNGFAQKLAGIFVNAKVREKATDKRKHDVPRLNGIRRYVNEIFTDMLDPKETVLGQLIRRERVMGHTGLVKLDKNYYKKHWRELVEEYLKIAPALLLFSNAKKDELIRKLKSRKSREDDLKRQLENEKLRNDKMEEKIEEIRRISESKRLEENTRIRNEVFFEDKLRQLKEQQNKMKGQEKMLQDLQKQVKELQKKGK